MAALVQNETYHSAFNELPSPKASYGASVNTLISPDISFGLPFQEACTKHVKNTFKCSKVYIIVSRTLSIETDNLERLVGALKHEGIEVVGVKKGMKPHTLWSQIVEVANEVRAVKADCVVTLGAGSLTDGGKLVVLALANNITEPSQLAAYSVESKAPPKDDVKPASVPLICIPTSLSGGEYFSLAGGTDDITTQHKQAFLQPGMGVSLIILDAELCTTTPPYYWLSTGVRSIDHCVETICSFESISENDVDAEAGLRLLIPGLLKTKTDNLNIEARHQCQMGVLLAMKSVRGGVPMGGSHAIGHQLGPMGVPHGITSCIMCPAVMKWNLENGQNIPGIKEKQDKIRGILWSEETASRTFVEAGLKIETADLGDLLDVFFRALGMPRTLKEVGIKASEIDKLAERTLADWWAGTNPIPLKDKAQVKGILEMVVGDLSPKMI
ncbi:alcohol dehydrogenase [Tricladium varicosporioides]|nr:alcohol dehydrogenase [Hymenoscyphus varicosporioides]